MRGARTCPNAIVTVPRIIPADAGSTLGGHRGQPACPDHPRGCGEHRSELGIRVQLHGIIPADAGSTLPGLSDPCFSRDHPRGCGEHNGYAKIKIRGAGSSPRVRGALVVDSGHFVQAGIIPADAGSTWGVGLMALITPDHPRGCGEH